MKLKLIIILISVVFLTNGCSVDSAIRKGVKTIYKTAVDERSIRNIIKDKKLTTLIMAEILADDVTKVLDISVKCYFGFPFVVGQCKTLDEAGKVVEICRRISGKPVVPYIVKKGEKEDGCNIAINLKITTEINARLVADKKIFASNIFVKTVNCTPVLMGVTGSEEISKTIIKHAENTGGVKDVRSFLVATGTNRSWDSVVKAIGSMAENTDGEKPNTQKKESIK